MTGCIVGIVRPILTILYGCMSCFYMFRQKDFPDLVSLKKSTFVNDFP